MEKPVNFTFDAPSIGKQSYHTKQKIPTYYFELLSVDVKLLETVLRVYVSKNAALAYFFPGQPLWKILNEWGSFRSF